MKNLFAFILLLLAFSMNAQTFEYNHYSTKIETSKDTSYNSFETDIQMVLKADTLVLIENGIRTPFKVTEVLSNTPDAIFLQFGKACCVITEEKAILHMVYNDLEGNPYIHVTNTYTKL